VRGKKAVLAQVYLWGFAINWANSGVSRCLRPWWVSNLTAAIERFAAKPFELQVRLGVM